jgi:hypothetical protein
MGAASTFETHSSRTHDASAEADPGSSAGDRLLAAPLALSGAALLLIFLATPHGLGVSPDSTQYLSAADHLLRGDGLRVHWWDEGTQPLTHFPPAFAVALAALARVGLTPDVAVRTLNSAALIAVGMLSFALTRRATGGSAAAGVAGAALVVLARDVLAAHAMVWSEPLFLALMLAALLATVRAVERDSMAAVVAAALLTGAAGLTRYVVPALIGAIALSLLFMGTAPARRRGLRTLVFLVIASLPLAILFAFNEAQGVSATNRQWAFHPPDMEELTAALRAAYYWIVPLHAPVWLEALVVTAFGVTTTWFVVAFIRSRHRHAACPSPAAHRTRTVMTTFGLCYVAFLVSTLTLLDAQSTPGARLLLPLVPAIAIIVVAGLHDALRIPERRPPAIALAAALSLGVVCSAATWVAVSRRDGLGYSAPSWHNSPLIAAVRALGPGTTVYTNHPGAVLFQTGREVLGIPRLANPNSRVPNAAYAIQMATVCRQSSHRRVAYAHFTTGPGEWFLPSLYEVRRRWHSGPSLVTADGVLDTVPAGCATGGAKPGNN